MVRMGFPGEAVVKNLPAVHKTHEMWVQSVSERSSGGGNGNPLRYYLPGEWTEAPGRL